MLRSPLPRRTALVSLAALVTSLWLPLRAEELRDTSLGLVPADASFYSSQLKLGEQFAALAKSRLAARIVELVEKAANEEQGDEKKLADRFKEQFREILDENETLQIFEAWRAAPENQELVEMVRDCLAGEVFMYGSHDYTEIWQVYGEFDRRMRVEMRRVLKEKAAELDGETDIKDLVDQERVVPWERLSSLEVPETVIGFRLTDKDRARRQLARLKPLLPLVASQPDFPGEAKTVKVGEEEFITLVIDGARVPWDEVQEGLASSTEDGEVKIEIDMTKRVVEILKTKKLTVSLGIRGDWLLLSFAADQQHLERIGGGDVLLDRPELARLRDTAGRGRLVAVSYAGNEYARSGRTLNDLLDSMLIFADAGIPQLEDFDDAMKTRLQRDARELAADMKRFVPKPGGRLRFALWTDRGYEGYVQSWRENLHFDGTRPLTITEHAGGDPLLLLAERVRYAPDDYHTIVKWIKKADGYMQDFGLEQLEPEQLATYETFRKEAAPILTRADKLIGEMLLPALKDGQAALVLDAKLKSRIHPLLPGDEPLPVFEPALVWGVSDRDLLKKAVAEGVDIVNTIAARIHDLAPEDVPEWTVPPAEKTESPEGTLYTYPLPTEAGIDERIAPTGALSGDTALLALSPEQARRLLKPTPLRVDGGPIAEHKGPAAAVAYVNFAGLLDAAQPWIELAIRHGGDIPVPDLDEVNPLAPAGIWQRRDGLGGLQGVTPSGEEFVVEAAADEDGDKAEESESDPERAIAGWRIALKMMRCLRNYSSITFVDGETLVTHFEWRLKDLEEE